MKRVILIFAAFAAWTATAATPGRTATENYVTQKIAEAFSALPNETDPTVPAWAKAATPPQTMTTNAVCSIVTNETPGAYKMIPHLDEAKWEFSGTGVVQGVTYSLTFYFNYEDDWDGVSYYSWHCELSGSDGTHGMFGPSFNDTTDVITSMAFFNDEWEEIGITATQILPQSRNALGLARLKDIGDLPTPQGVTNIVRDLSLGGIWDETLKVWWTPRMRNGSLTYEATTNVNLNAEH